MAQTILIIDDDRNMRWVLKKGYCPSTALMGIWVQRRKQMLDFS